MASAHSQATIRQCITYSSVQQETTRPSHLFPNSQAASRFRGQGILRPSFDFYQDRYLIDPYSFEQCLSSTARTLANGAGQIFRVNQGPARSSATQQDIDPAQARQHYTAGRVWTVHDVANKECDVSDLMRSRQWRDLELEHERIYSAKQSVQSTGDIFMFPGHMGRIISRSGNQYQAAVNQAIKDGTFPLYQGKPISHEIPVFSGFIGFLEHAFKLKQQAWKYQAFCATVGWTMTRGDVQTMHLGVVYGGVMQDPVTRTSGFKLVFLESHPQSSGRFENLPLEVMALGQLMGLTRIYRVFGSQGNQPNCSTLAMMTLQKIVLQDIRPDLQRGCYQVISLSPGKPSADSATIQTSSLQLVFPDWMQE